MRTQDFFTYDACRVCGQTPCNCTHIQESHEARPVKDRDDFLNRREFLYRQLNTPGLSKQDRDVIRHAIQDLEASARATGLVKEDLRKWFKEKWVRFGPDGKIRGDCARGDDSEGKPKCLPQSKAHALGKKGRASAAARKRRQDPNPERKGAAINVATKEAVSNTPQAAAQVDYALYSNGKPSVKMSDRLLAYKFLAALKRRFPEQKHEIRTVQRVQEMKCSECGGPAFSDLLLSEKKDACYNKVRSRYKVWPSAYASGALVQCRKKGAANWGNKSKNEDVAEANPNQQVSRWHPETSTYRGSMNKIPTSTSVDVDDITARGQQVDFPTHRELARNANIENPEDVVYKNDLKKLVQQHFKSLPNDIREVLKMRFWDGMTLEQTAKRLGVSAAYVRQLEAKGFRMLAHSSRLGQVYEADQLDERCWDTHRQAGMKKKGDRMVPNCVPKEGASPKSAIGEAISQVRR